MPPAVEHSQTVSYAPPQMTLNNNSSEKKFEYQPFHSVAETEYIKATDSRPVSVGLPQTAVSVPPPQTATVSVPPPQTTFSVPPPPQATVSASQANFQQMVETTYVHKEDPPFALYASGGQAPVQPLVQEQSRPVSYTVTEPWRPSPSVAVDNQYTSNNFSSEMRTNHTYQIAPTTSYTAQAPQLTSYTTPVPQLTSYTTQSTNPTFSTDYKPITVEQPKLYTTEVSHPVTTVETHQVTTIE